MKLFYTKKQVQGIVEEIRKNIESQYESKIGLLEEKIKNKEFKYLEDYNKYYDKSKKLEETNKYHQRLIELRESDIEKLSKKLKQANGAKGGFIARINDLIKQVDEVTEKFDKYRAEKEIEIADLKSDRYLIKEIPKDKSRQKQIMQTKSSSKQSKIIKNVKEKL